MKLTKYSVSKPLPNIFKPVNNRFNVKYSAPEDCMYASLSQWRKTCLNVNAGQSLVRDHTSTTGYYGSYFLSHYTSAQLFEASYITYPLLNTRQCLVWWSRTFQVLAYLSKFKIVFTVFFNMYQPNNQTSIRYFTTKQPNRPVLTWTTSQVKYL